MNMKNIITICTQKRRWFSYTCPCNETTNCNYHTYPALNFFCFFFIRYIAYTTNVQLCARSLLLSSCLGAFLCASFSIRRAKWASHISTSCGDSKTFLASSSISTGLDLDASRIMPEGGSLGTLPGSRELSGFRKCITLPFAIRAGSTVRPFRILYRKW